jgi:hypothetical protein
MINLEGNFQAAGFVPARRDTIKASAADLNDADRDGLRDLLEKQFRAPRGRGGPF